jgi:hypothetical protein
MMRERREGSSRRFNRLATLAAGYLLVSGCTTTHEVQSHPSSTTATVIKKSVQLTVSFDNLGCDHPCVLPIYKRPHNTEKTRGNVLNVFPSMPDGYAWPNEKPGENKVIVVCQVIGQLLHDGAGNASDVWDVVEMSTDSWRQNAANTQAVRELRDGSAVFGHQGTRIYGYVADMWVGNEGAQEDLLPCTTTQDPQQHPAVQP